MKDEGDVPAIDITGSQGVQAGSGNVQHNHVTHNWQSKSPLDPASLGHVNPHTAAEWIRQLPHDDTVLILAKASSGEISEALGVLIEMDEATAVALLADVSPRKFRELVTPLLKDESWLANLPDAAKAISSIAAKNKWDRDSSASRLRHENSYCSAEAGFTREYGKGQICWNGRAAFMIEKVIAECYVAEGGAAGVYGFPISDSGTAESQTSPPGHLQRFEGGVIISSIYGTFGVPAPIWECYDRIGGSSSWLGFPVGGCVEFSEEIKIVDARNDSFRHPIASLQRFEGGELYFTRRGTYAVRAEFSAQVEGQYPISGEMESGTSPFGTSGLVQNFVGPDDSRTSAIFSSDQYGSLFVREDVNYFYGQLGGPESRLGFPVGKIESVDQWFWRQDFEGGSLVQSRHPEQFFFVPTETVELITKDLSVLQKIGCPKSEEYSIGDGTDRIQFFDGGGAVLLRDGERKVWNPDPMAPSVGEKSVLETLPSSEALQDSTNPVGPRSSKTDEWRLLPLNLESAQSSWKEFPIARIRMIAREAGFAPESDSAKGIIKDRDREFRTSLGRLVSLALVAGASSIGDFVVLINRVDSLSGQLAQLVRESAQRGFRPIDDPCEVIALSMLIDTPDLRIRAALPFRDELEDALDVVSRSKDTQ